MNAAQLSLMTNSQVEKPSENKNLEKADSGQTLTFTGSDFNHFLMWAGEILLLLLLFYD